MMVAACETSGPATRPEHPPTEAPPGTRVESPPVAPGTRVEAPSPTPSGATSFELEEEFRGHYRVRATTEYAMVNGTLAPVEAFADLDALKAFLAPQTDQAMRRRYPYLGDVNTAVTQRVPEELHNVSVVAYIHAVKHDSGPRGDQGYHVMLGSSLKPGEGLFLAAQASASSANGSHGAQLAQARRQLLAIVGACQCEGHFTQVSPPIPVRVAGSLFFDAAQAIGGIGPAYAQPFTAWEIQPMLSVERLGAAAGRAAPSASAASSAPAAEAEAGPAAALRTRYAALREQLEHSPFQQHLYLESVESSRALQGDVYALLDYPFATVSDAFRSPAHWCDALILHLNVKYCHATTRGSRAILSVAVGRKYDQPLADTFRFEFSFSAMASAAEYMEVDLDAGKGPLGTRNYHIALEAVDLEDGRVLLHIRYSYAYGFLGRLAMKAYLATSGRGKAGFTVIGTQHDGTPRYIGGVRGAIERNTLRYYLAVDAYLGALAAPAPQRFEQSLEHWFTATERYALQLHEVDRDTYFAMKRREYLRQQTLQ